MTNRQWIRAKWCDAGRLGMLSFKAADLKTQSRKSRQYSWLKRASLALNIGLGVYLTPRPTLVLWKDNKSVAMIEHQGWLLLAPRLWCQHSKLRGEVYLHNLFSIIGAQTLLSKETITNLFDTIDPSGQRSFIVKAATTELESRYQGIFGSKHWKKCTNRTVNVLGLKHLMLTWYGWPGKRKLS